MSAALKLVPRQDVRRPYRLLDATTNTYLPHRCYSIRLNAHKAALWEATISKVGTVIEVNDVSLGHLLGTYHQDLDQER
jgi:hypothetical protein